MAMDIIDRRLNPSGKSLTNKQRVLRREREVVRQAIREAVAKSSADKIGQGHDFTIKRDPKVGQTTREPTFHHDRKKGNHDIVLPGNKDFVTGDTLPKPKDENGSGGAGTGGDGEDDFIFTLTGDEILDIYYEDLELPDMRKISLHEMPSTKPKRAGFSTTGIQNNMNVLRTMRNSLGRRISSGRPKLADVTALEEKLKKLKEIENPDQTTCEAIKEGDAQLAIMKGKHSRIPYIDPQAMRFNRFEPKPVPTTQAVMFRLMDVSSSMVEDRKDTAKRFFMLLRLFLSRSYEKIEDVYIRHTDEAKEVDENTFFHDPATGGTIVSSALEKMMEIIAERYPPGEWNIYVAQASDGDNSPSDNAICLQLLSDKILPITQHYAYVEVNKATADSILWKQYATLLTQHGQPNGPLDMRKIKEKLDILPVFRDFFVKRAKSSLAAFDAA